MSTTHEQTKIARAARELERSINKSDLVSRIAQHLPDGLRDDVEICVNLILGEMKRSISLGQRVELRDFGVFTIRTMPARIRHNPATLEKFAAPDKRRVHFKPGKALRDRVLDATTHAS